MTRPKAVCSMVGCGKGRSAAGAHHEELTRLRRFPKDPLTCLQWLKASGNPNLINHSISKLSSSFYFLCDQHFEVSDGAGQRYLNRGAVPKILTHSSPLTYTDLERFLKTNNLSSSLLPDPLHNDFPVAATTAVSSQPKESDCRGLDKITVQNVREFLESVTPEEVMDCVVLPERSPSPSIVLSPTEESCGSNATDGSLNPASNCDSLPVQYSSDGAESFQLHDVSSFNSFAADSGENSDVFFEHSYACVRPRLNRTSLHEFTGDVGPNDFSLQEGGICGEDGERESLERDTGGSSDACTPAPISLRSYISSFTPDDECLQLQSSSPIPVCSSTESLERDTCGSSDACSPAPISLRSYISSFTPDDECLQQLSSPIPVCGSTPNISVHDDIAASDVTNLETATPPVTPEKAPSPLKNLLVVPNGSPSRPQPGYQLRPCPPGFTPTRTPSRSKPPTPVLQHTRTRSRKSLLSDFGVTKADATPRKQALWSAYMASSRELTRSQRKKFLLRKRLAKSRRELSVENVLSFLDDKLSPGTRIIVENELKNHGRPTYGKRYSRDLQCLSLALQKKGPKAYKFATKVMGLPSNRTLGRLANSVDLQPGINDSLFKQLKLFVQKQKPKDRVCSILFDEMAIRSGVYFNESKDNVDGFVKLGDGHESSVQADHALVFMVQGLNKNWKQPVAFYLTKNTVSADDLVRILRKELIPALQRIGIIVKCTICDRGATNVSAINKLTKDAPPDEPYFIVNKQKIFTLFDYPHLLKCTRNHFLDKKFFFPNGTFADIEHIREIVKSDNNSNTLRVAPKLSEVHVNMNKQLDTRAKMRVKYAAQLFSKSVEAVLKLVDQDKRQAGLQPEGHLATAEFVGFMDKLFDSVNGWTIFPTPGKPLFSALRNDSGHLEFWEEAKAHIDSWRLFSEKEDKATGETVLKETGRAALQDKWIHSLIATKCLWDDLRDNYGFDCLVLRRLNQDALENFFGQIRLSLQCNNNPTVVQFIAAFKTALVDLVSKMNVRRSNCETDDLTFLASLNALLGGNDATKDTLSEDSFVDNVDYSPLIPDVDDPAPSSSIVESRTTLQESFSKHSVVYVSGYLARRLLRKCDCLACRCAFRTNEIDENHLFIKLKEYNPSKPSLVLPSNELTHAVNHAKSLFETLIRPTLHISNIRKRFYGIIRREVDFSWLCQEHHHGKLRDFCKFFCRVFIHNECKRINKGDMWRHLSSSNARMMARFLQPRRLAIARQGTQLRSKPPLSKQPRSQRPPQRGSKQRASRR